ncbi:MAG TPA: fused MFS/spermidine synthase [Clostridia bacterium]|nr:fused MFS/spermidine synthase [Clostridia bacterium]
MRKNLFIYITSFLCGMTVMGVELSATRLLAPYFGTSSIVYTVVIGLIMISMSIGNVLGGRSADKHNDLGRLFSLLWVAALWVAIIPLAGKYIITLITVLMMYILPGNLLVSGSVISCLLVFSAPLLILGMVSPYLVKLGVRDMENSGRTTGEIYAASTIGSIIGTFIPTFLTIPYIGTMKSFLVFALALNLICLYYFITRKKGLVKGLITTVLTAILLIIPISNPFAFWTKVVLEDESLYNYLQVTENSDSVIFSTNVAFGVQSIYMKNKTLSGFYYDYAITSPLMLKDSTVKKPADILVLGMGTGTFAKECKYFFPETRIDGVEIDQKIVDLSKKYFGLTDKDARVYVNDGRTFLSTPQAGKYDIILVDAYHDITIPFHMSTREFFSQVKEHLKPGGVIMININMRSDKSSEVVDYLTQTLRSNMNKVYKFDVPNTTNVFVYSSDNNELLSDYKSNTELLAQDDPLKNLAEAIVENSTEVTDTKYVFTDDLAPVEVLGQKVLNDIVSQELVYFRKELENSGSGVLDVFNMIS